MSRRSFGFLSVRARVSARALSYSFRETCESLQKFAQNGPTVSSWDRPRCCARGGFCSPSSGAPPTPHPQPWSLRTLAGPKQGKTGHTLFFALTQVRPLLYVFECVCVCVCVWGGVSPVRTRAAAASTRTPPSSLDGCAPQTPASGHRAQSGHFSFFLSPFSPFFFSGDTC